LKKLKIERRNKEKNEVISSRSTRITIESGLKGGEKIDKEVGDKESRIERTKGVQTKNLFLLRRKVLVNLLPETKQLLLNEL